MSTFSGRRAPNVSQYLQNLNLPAGAPELAQEDFGALGDGGLDFLTNTEFFDFDNFDRNVNDFPQRAQGVQPAVQQPGMAQQSPQGLGINNPQYQFSEFQTYPQPIDTSPTSTVPPSPHNGLQGAYPPQPPLFHSGDKRKASAAGMPTAADLEEASRVAAEEDKRRRNTAASARFRVKKKQREQALEKQTKEMLEKMQKLEGKVQQLEMENKWLKGLITEKNGGTEPKMPAQAEKKEEETEERSTDGKRKGVGTEDDDAEDAADESETEA